VELPGERTREVTLDLGACGHSGQRTRARREPARTGARAIACTVRGHQTAPKPKVEDCVNAAAGIAKEQESLTACTDRTVRDYGIHAGHPAGRWPADSDSGALAGRAALIYV
jgi:hypothetical protein